MRIRKSIIFAIVLMLGIGLWFAFNSRGEAVDVYEAGAPTETETALPVVLVRDVTAGPYTPMLEVYGRTAPNREVDVRAKTAAAVVATPVAEGARVSRGTVLCRQDVDARRAVLDQARAAVAKAETDLRASQTLVERGFKSSASIAGDQANLDAARAQLRQAENELDNVIIRAPFAGVFDERMAEVGDYLAPGQACGTVVELHPLKVETEVTEGQVAMLQPGRKVQVELATGQVVEGEVSFIESRANPATRTVRVEAALPNPELTLKAGVSATLALGLDEVQASQIPARVLTLDEAGVTGVRHVVGESVRFAPVTVIGDSGAGTWVTGLPERARVIVEGQNFVADGTKVEVRREGEARSSQRTPVASRSE